MIKNETTDNGEEISGQVLNGGLSPEQSKKGPPHDESDR